jgi:hypothetical protein
MPRVVTAVKIVHSLLIGGFVAACAANPPLVVGSWEPAVKAHLEKDAREHAEYKFEVIGKRNGDFPFVSIEGWLKQDPGIREFRLHPKKALLSEDMPNKCLSGVFENDSEFELAKKASGRHVRIYATYGPADFGDGTAGWSVITNTCMGLLEIHGITFVVLD